MQQIRLNSSDAEAIRRLRAAGIEVSDAQVDRAAYSSDASLYRVVPAGVVYPRDADDVYRCLHTARDLGVSLTARGAGTSIAGNAVGPGLVVDVRRHLHQVLSVDAEAGRVRVQPGISLGDLQAALAPTGWRVGPDPSSGSRATIGGMIGNDACGPRSLAYGRTSDAVTDLTLITGTGEIGHTRGDFADVRVRLGAVVQEHLGALRTELGRFPRQLSGYGLHRMLPENGRNLTGALVGSEGTLGLVTEAELRLVRRPRHHRLVAIGFGSIVEAAAAVPELLTTGPTACEGLDARIVQAVRDRRGPAAVPDLPPGQAWLLVEYAGDDRAELAMRVRSLGATLDDPMQAASVWRIREDGAGLSGRAPSGRPAWSGWEDAAVPPAALAGYLRDFDELVADHGLTTMPYGHFGEGCVHARLDFPLDRPGARAQLRSFLLDAADLVARHGGSLSGEHGDGRARGELLPRLYSPAVLHAFAQVKDIFDPDSVLNPELAGAAVDDDLRRPAARGRTVALGLRYPDDHHDLTEAIHRCTGVGRCVVGTADPATVMCPSYAATGQEKDSTRGRARVLQELANGNLVAGWRDPAVTDALDLCLSCKGCLSDCPTGVDMASYKSEALFQAYRGRLRPRSHYSLGRLPQWLRIAARAPRMVNALARSALARPTLAVAGLESDRTLPELATQTFRSWFAAQPVVAGRPVVLFVDTFTDYLSPQVGRAAVRVLQRAGYAPTVPDQQVCCGLTYLSTGQLDQAKRALGRTVDALEQTDGPIVGLEPSCTAVLRHDAARLVDAGDVPARTRTLAELLADTPHWSPPDLSGTSVIAQPHCHHHAVMGWETDGTLLRQAGVQVQRLGGCCGLAGNFGLERGHGDISRSVAGLQLLPALETAGPEQVVLADGFSCRTQIADLSARRGRHLAELLDQAP